MSSHPLIRLLPGRDRRLKAGHPWAFSNEIAMTAEARALPPGSVVRLAGDDGVRHGLFHFNPHSLIAARLLDRDSAAAVDAAWYARRLREALELRQRLGLRDACRLVHAEADGLPGLVVDRYGDALAVQANTAGMHRALPELLDALRDVLAPRAVVARNDSPVRALEGLEPAVALLHGADAAAEIEENGVRHALDLLGGQKTGWFHDQRENRARVAALASGATVLDAFAHTGGFGLAAAKAGAAEVTLLDRSQPALDLALRSAAANRLAACVSALRGDAVEEMERMLAARRTFGVVVCDPPAYAKARKDQPAALRAYARLARTAAGLVEPGGVLLLASCSHHVAPAEFAEANAHGLHRARREARLLFAGGAGPDHPVHPMLPESAYLKAMLYQLR
jgi:23S rRNA (cytosine1962-C5)-methyltransferase